MPLEDGSELTLSRFNDATVYGTLNPDMLRAEMTLACSKEGATTRSGHWKNLKFTLGSLLKKLSSHVEGDKDGECFLQGPAIDGVRTLNSMSQMNLLVLDLDTGEDIDAVRKRVQDLGLFAVIYSTHSHLKPVSSVKRDAMVKWVGDKAGDPDVNDVKAFLLQEKKYQPYILEGAELLDERHTAEGMKMFIQHRPMPKFRVVLLLKEPFIVAKRGKTHKAGIDEWRERYAGASKMLGAWFDRSCCDTSRIFFFPRHPKGAAGFQIDIVAGAPLDIETVDRVTAEEVRRSGMGAFEVAAEEMHSATYRTANMKRFFAKYGDAFDIESFLMEVDPDGDRGPRASGLGRTHKCPNDDAHTNAGDENDKGFFCVNACDSETGSAVAHCSHSGCSGLDRLNFTDLACQAAGIDDALALKKWVPETVEDGEEPAEADPEAADEGDEDEAPEPNRTYSNLAEARRAVRSATPESDAGHIAVNIGMSGFSATEEDSLRKELSKKTGVGIKAISDEMKKGRAKASKEDDGGLNDDTASALAKLNKNYACALLGGKFRIIKEPEVSGRAPEIMEKDSFVSWMANQRVTITDGDGKTKLVPVAEQWFSWPERRQYDRLVFDPNEGDIGKAYNIWKGFAHKPKKGNWSLLRQHVFDNVCRGDADHFEWLMTWIAQIFQQPGKKMGSAVVIKGKRGTGKSILFDWIKKAIGEAALKVAKREEIVGGFNKHQQGLILLVCEEAFWAGDTQASGVLKDMITSDEMLLTPKGIDSIRFENYMRMALISNERWIVPAGLEDERRFFVLECGDARRGDIEFFEAIQEQMGNGGVEAMVHEMMHWKPKNGNWNVLRKPPVTQALSEQAQETLTINDRFFYKVIEDGGYMVPSETRGEEGIFVDLPEKKGCFISRDDLQRSYTAFISQTTAGKHKIGDFKLFKSLAMDWLCASNKETRTSHYVGEKFGKDERRRCMAIPPLSEIRARAVEVKRLSFSEVEGDVDGADLGAGVFD